MKINTKGVGKVIKAWIDAGGFEQANSLLRSAYQIAMRQGVDTNWEAFKEQVGIELDRQHAIMYPDTHKEFCLKQTKKKH